MNTLNINDIKYSFELGSEFDIFESYYIDKKNKLYRQINKNEVLLDNKRRFKKDYGISFTNLIKKLKKEYFVRIKNELLSEEKEGFYFKNDHQQLYKDNVLPKKLNIIK